MSGLTEYIHTSKHSGMRNSVLGTRDLMAAAMLGLVGSPLVVPLSTFTPVFVTTPRTLAVLRALVGAWYIAYLLPGLFAPCPGAFLVAGFPMDIIITLAAPLRPSAIIGNPINAAFLEVPILLFLYRKWSQWAYVIDATIFGGLSSIMYGSAYHVAQNPPQFNLGIVFSLTSCYLTLVPALLLKRRLARAGVEVKQ